MKINIQIDENCKETEVTIVTNELNDDLNEAISRLKISQKKKLLGYTGDNIQPIEIKDVIRFYASDKKVYAKTASDLFQIRLKLYEVEEHVNNNDFARISKNEIINLKEIKGFNLDVSGVISLILSNNETTYVSRSYIAKVKSIFGI